MFLGAQPAAEVTAKHHEQPESTPGGQAGQSRPPTGAPTTNLNTARTVTNNLHNMGAIQQPPPPTSGAAPAQDPATVVTTHHTYHGTQASFYETLSAFKQFKMLTKLPFFRCIIRLCSPCLF